eukprot:6916853-Pyramimonas_sp.AAC.1
MLMKGTTCFLADGRAWGQFRRKNQEAGCRTAQTPRCNKKVAAGAVSGSSKATCAPRFKAKEDVRYSITLPPPQPIIISHA